MSTGRVETAAQKVKDSVKEAIGKLTGDAATETQGAAEQAKAEKKKTASSSKKKTRRHSKR